MIIVRMIKGIKTHFPSRIAEWFLSVALINWGLILMRTEEVFTKYKTFTGLQNIADESTWAIFAFIVGLIRLVALAINGTFYGTWYSRFSPHIRGVMSFLSCFCWVQITYSFLIITPLSPSVAIYATLVVVDMFCMATAWTEAGRNDKQVKRKI